MWLELDGLSTYVFEYLHFWVLGLEKGVLVSYSTLVIAFEGFYCSWENNRLVDRLENWREMAERLITGRSHLGG